MSFAVNISKRDSLVKLPESWWLDPFSKAYENKGTLMPYSLISVFEAGRNGE